MAVAVLVPLAYYLTIAATRNQLISLFQLAFFFTPSVVLFKLYRIRRAVSKEALFRGLVLTVSVSLMVTWALNDSLTFWLKIFPPPKDMHAALQKMLSYGKPLGLYRDLLVMALVPAVCEEFFFRGFLLTALKSYVSPRTAIVISAFFFAFYHVNPWFAPFFFILGLLFGWLYLKTNNLGMAVLAHFINNAYGIVLYHHFGVVF